MELKDYRLKAGLTLQKVEDMTGISNSYLSRLESGRVKNPGVQILYTLSKAYKTDLTQLVTTTGIVQEMYCGRIIIDSTQNR